MDMVKRPLVAVTAASVLALSGAGAAWACGGSGGQRDAGSYPGDTSWSYPTSTTPSTTSTDPATSTTATTAAHGHARRAHHPKHAKRS
jgi:hypothetical protein